jgi:hypothetical protein
MPLNCVPREYRNFFEISPKKKDVGIDVSYMFVQSNFKNSSPIIFYQLSRKCQKINEFFTINRVFDFEK